MGARRNRRETVVMADMPSMPSHMNMTAANVPCETPKVDPDFEESNKLRAEAERALTRYLVHAASRGDTHRAVCAAKAIEQLRNW